MCIVYKSNTEKYIQRNRIYYLFKIQVINAYKPDT